MKGVFTTCADKRAFVDRVIMSILNQIKVQNSPLLKFTTNKGCYARTSFFARYAEGTIRPTGNPVRIWWGKKSKFRNVPAARLEIRSECSPITAAEVLIVMRALGATQFRVSYAELTFDFKGKSQREIAEEVF